MQWLEIKKSKNEKNYRIIEYTVASKTKKNR